MSTWNPSASIRIYNSLWIEVDKSHKTAFEAIQLSFLSFGKGPPTKSMHTFQLHTTFYVRYVRHYSNRIRTQTHTDTIRIRFDRNKCKITWTILPSVHVCIAVCIDLILKYGRFVLALFGTCLIRTRLPYFIKSFGHMRRRCISMLLLCGRKKV